MSNLYLNSGIAGLDELLHGGFLPNSNILVKGFPGTGKTTLGIEFVYQGIIRYNEPGIIITFEQFPHQLYRDAANYGWELQELEKQGLLRVICTSPEVILDRSSNLLDELVREIGARRLVLDSLTQLGMVTGDQDNQRRLIYGICSGFKRMGLTTMLLQEAHSSPEQMSFTEFIVDTVIHLHFIESQGSRKRYIEITKSRGHDFDTGKFAFKFDTNGIRVLRIAHPQVLPHYASRLDSKQKLSSGVPGLDEILPGGLLPGTTVLVEGDSGTGKSILGMQYLLQGFYEGEKGLILTTEYEADLLHRYVSTFSLPDLAKALHQDDIEIFDNFFSYVNVEEVMVKLVEKAKADSIKRVVIDSVNSFAELAESALVLKGHLRNFFRSLNLMGCTTLVILGEDAQDSRSQLQGIIRPLVQGQIKLSSTLEKGKRKWLVEITKMKGGKFVPGVHRAEIGNHGLQVFRRLGRK